MQKRVRYRRRMFLAAEMSRSTTTMTTNDSHPDVSVHVEQDGSAATASTGQLEHSVKRVAASDKPKQSACAKQEVDHANTVDANKVDAVLNGSKVDKAREVDKRKCSCIARLKSCYYSFKLSIMGKLMFSLLAFLVPYDVVTDVIATWELYSSGLAFRLRCVAPSSSAFVLF